MTADGRFVEVQGTAEATPFSREEMSLVLDRASAACRELFHKQAELVGSMLTLTST
jgi:ribonuclease PH